MLSLRFLKSDAGWSSPVARWAHNPKVAGSNPAPATNQVAELDRGWRRPPPSFLRKLSEFRFAINPFVASATVVRVVGEGARAGRGAARSPELVVGLLVVADSGTVFL